MIERIRNLVLRYFGRRVMTMTFEHAIFDNAGLVDVTRMMVASFVQETV